MVGAFPDANSALMLVCARLRYMESSLWGSKLYLNMKHLEAMDLKDDVITDSTAGLLTISYQVSAISNVRKILPSLGDMREKSAANT